MWARFSARLQTSPRAHPTSCTRGTGSFPGVKNGPVVTLTPHSLLMPWSWKGRAIPLLPLWTVRPVQSLSACTRVNFTLPQCLYTGALYLTSVPVQGALYLCLHPFGLNICFQWWRVLSVRGLFVRLITHSEESIRVWRVWAWTWSLDTEEALAYWRLKRLKNHLLYLY